MTLNDSTAQPSALTDKQKELYEALRVNGANGTLLMSVIEKSTGQQRAVVCSVREDGDSFITQPLFLLLEQEDDILRFDPGPESELIQRPGE